MAMAVAIVGKEHVLVVHNKADLQNGDQMSGAIAVSCVTGRGLEEFCAHLFHLEPRNRAGPVTAPFSMTIEHVYRGPEVGLVVRGRVQSGRASIGPALLGPAGAARDPDKHYDAVHVASLQRHRIPVKHAIPGQYVTVGLERCPVTPVKGQLLCHAHGAVMSTSVFTALMQCVGGNTSATNQLHGMVYVSGNRVSGSMSLDAADQRDAADQQDECQLFTITLPSTLPITPTAPVIFISSLSRWVGSVIR
jgi:GTPase